MSRTNTYTDAKVRRLLAVGVVAALLLCGCSRKGVHMPKHRKQRHCDCPTFSYLPTAAEGSTLAYDGTAIAQ